MRHSRNGSSTGAIPIGMRITPVDDGQRTAYQVVGVAGNARTQSLRGDVEPRYFVAAAQAAAVRRAVRPS